MVKKVINKQPSIICNNCIGGSIYNDFGIQFKSPAINLFFYADDYIDFLENLANCINKPLQLSWRSKYQQQLMDYPVGNLDGIEIQFLHYGSFDDAEKKWHNRISRIDFDNIYIIGSDRDNCTVAIRDRFAKLPFKNKVFFTSQHPRYKHEVCFNEYAENESVGDLIKDDKAWYFYFDVPLWLNTGIIKRYFLRRILFLAFRKIKSRKSKLTADIF